MSGPFIFAGGGTGGHLFPGLAVAAAVRRLEPSSSILFYTTDRGLDSELLERSGFTQVRQTVRPFTLRPLRLPAFVLAWRASVRVALASMRNPRPRAVLGLGGYAAGPAVVAARKLGIRCAILNPDAAPGLANRFLARRADLVVTQWEASRPHFSSRTPVQAWGCPIRSEFSTTARDHGRARFTLDLDRPVCLVTGASQGARSVNRTLPLVWPAFLRDHPDWQLLHLSGAADELETRAAYAAAGIDARVLAFTHDMPAALAAADVVISRAGASTLAELCALGRPSILLPYPFHRDHHQRANAQVLVRTGAALLVNDERDPLRNRDPLLAALRHVAPDNAREAMAAAARRLARPQAAERVARWMLGREPTPLSARIPMREAAPPGESPVEATSDHA
jgi:UDP-N-acetylglucosamine--N-acetylmuramyl-(pentapeptide) pyrophosphoryl-undecaprenol N-acetylglucosamine transferase